MSEEKSSSYLSVEVKSRGPKIVAEHINALMKGAGQLLVENGLASYIEEITIKVVNKEKVDEIKKSKANVEISKLEEEESK